MTIKDKSKSLKESIQKLNDLLLVQKSEGNTRGAKITQMILKRLESDLKKEKGK